MRGCGFKETKVSLNGIGLLLLWLYTVVYLMGWRILHQRYILDWFRLCVCEGRTHRWDDCVLLFSPLRTTYCGFVLTFPKGAVDPKLAQYSLLSPSLYGSVLQGVCYSLNERTFRFRCCLKIFVFISNPNVSFCLKLSSLSFLTSFYHTDVNISLTLPACWLLLCTVGLSQLVWYVLHSVGAGERLMRAPQLKHDKSARIWW